VAVAIFTTDPARAAAVLREGGICVYPTETFYGLGALVTRPAAIARLAAAKLRPEGKPLPLVAADAPAAFALWARVPPGAERLAARFWPGPLTLAAPAAGGIHPDVSAGGTVAVRVPGSPLARTLCRLAGGALISTSANLSGGDPPSRIEELAPVLVARVDAVLDGGATPGGRPSTVVALGEGPPRLVREGAIPWVDVQAALRDGGLPGRLPGHRE
jgi:L-threonylcarbamoyladenylate synthase